MAGVKVGVGYVEVRPDLSRFSAELRQGLSNDISKASETASQSLKKSFGDAAKFAAGAFAGAKVADFLKGSVQAASDLAEAVNVTGLTFGDARGEIDKFVKSAAAIGLSETAARELSSSVGGLLKNMGLSTAQTVTWSKTLLQLGADLGSAFNAEPADAIQAIGAALRGETEPIRRFNVVIDDATVKQKAVELGLARSTSEVSRQAKTMATLALITEQTKDAQGDFANTADGLANSQRQLAANMENLKASLGEALVPVLARGTGVLNELLGTFNELPGPVREAASTLLLAAGAMSAVGIAAAVLGPKLAAARLELAGMGAAGAVANKSIGALAAVGKGLAAVAVPVGIAAALNSEINKMTGDVKKLAGATEEELLPAFDKLRGSRSLWGRFVEFVNDTGLDQAAENQAVFKKVLEAGDLALAKRILTASRGRPVEKDLQKIWDDQVQTIRTLNKDQKETSEILADITGASEGAGGAIEGLGDKAGGAATGLEKLVAVPLSDWAETLKGNLESALDPLSRLSDDGADARERVTEAQKDLTKAQEEYDQALAAFKIIPLDSNADKLKAATADLDAAKKKVAEAKDDAAGVTFADLRDNLAGNLTDVKEWQKDLGSVAARGFPLLAAELTKLGPEAAGAIDEATRASGPALQKMQDAFVERSRLLSDDASLNAIEEQLGSNLDPLFTKMGTDAAVFFGRGFVLGLERQPLLPGDLADRRPVLDKPRPGILGDVPVVPGFGPLTGLADPTASIIGPAPAAPAKQQTNTFHMTFNEKADPTLIGKAVAWQLR